MELPGRGLRYSGNVESLNFPGIFARVVFFKSGVQSREKRRRYIEFQKFFLQGTIFKASKSVKIGFLYLYLTLLS